MDGHRRIELLAQVAWRPWAMNVVIPVPEITAFSIGLSAPSWYTLSGRARI
jgi:hypothetical protein